MGLAVRIKLVFVTSAIITLLQNWLAPVSFLAILVILSLVIFIFARLFLNLVKAEKTSSANLRFSCQFLYSHRNWMFLWLPILLLLFGIRYNFTTERRSIPKNWRPEIVKTSFTQSRSKTSKILYAKARILSTFKPGNYLASLEILPIRANYRKASLKSYTRYHKKNKNFRRRAKHSSNTKYYKKSKYIRTINKKSSKSNAGYYEKAKSFRNIKKNFSKVYTKYPREKKKRSRPKKYKYRNYHDYPRPKVASLAIYLKTNDYYLLSGCRIWLNLDKQSLPQALPENSFGDYLRRKQAVAWLQLPRQKIYRKNCRDLDLRGKFQNILGRTLYHGGFSLYQRGAALGLLLGKSGYMHNALKKKARHLGILHLFAASGLHLGIFYIWFFWPLGQILGKKSHLALSLPLIPCFLYMLLLGFPISLLRAFIFLSFHALQSFIHRKLQTHDLLLNSAIVILFLQPQNFLTLGTWLSFAAVSGILYFYPVIWTEFSKFKLTWLNPILQQAAISISASLFTLPILLISFHAYSYTSLIANVLLVPAVGLLMPLLVGGISLSIVTDGFISIFMEWGRLATEGFISLTQWLAQFSHYVQYDSLLCLPLFANTLLIFSLFGLYYYSHQRKSMRKIRLLLLAVLVFAISLLNIPIAL